MNSVPSWSYTALSQFENCPRQYQLAKVTKELPFVQSEAMIYGNLRHEQLELRVKEGKKLPDELQKMEPLIATLEKGVMANKIYDVQPELEFVFDRNLKPIHIYGQRTPKPFFLKGAWLRAKFDLVVLKDQSHMKVIDWKFGKFRPANDQLELFAGCAFKMMPELERVDTQFVYPDLNKTKTMTFFRAGADETDTVSAKSEPEIWENWLGRVNRLDKAYKADSWPCRPSGLCGWCDATPKQCAHSKK